MLEISVERYLERMIGRMIDINYHLITESGFPPSADYYQSFLQLERLGILPHDLAPTIAACAGLRSRIVHEYDEIDPARVNEALQTTARDVPQYLTHIYGYLERAPR
ncbi:MAG TPA: HepT-like ribonuclease domain-containing protein [Candidatus Methylomirabilis sp.]